MSNIQITQNRPIVQVDGRIVNQNTAKQSAEVRSLETGDRINGKILSMSNDGGAKNAQIQLGDDVVIQAKLQQGMALKEGQYVSFEVRGTSNNQISLTPLYENTAVDITALKALTAAGLEASQDNVNMVRAMMENGMSIDKDSLNSMHQVVSSFPDTDSSTLVQMKVLNIPINGQNITQFESYKNYEHQVVETMDSIIDELPDAYNQLSSENGLKAANDLYGNILKMLSDGTEAMAKAPQAGTENAQVQDSGASGIAQEQTAADGISREQAGTTLNPETQTLQEMKEGVALNGENTSGTLEALKGENSSETTAAINSDDPSKVIKNDNPDAATELKNDAKTESGQEQNKVQAALSDMESEAQAANNQGNKTIVLNKDFVNALKELQTQTGTTSPEISRILSQSNTGKEVVADETALLKELAEKYAKEADSSENAQKAFSKIFSSNEFNKLMKDQIKDQWLLEPRDVASKENVENFYSRLNAQARQLTETLTNSLGADSKIAQSANSLQNNIDFMNQLNQIFNYIQLPLKMADQDAHGDLYVYSNGRKKFEPGETVSAILHLDMDNLGPVDVYVKMKDTNVKTNFYVADEETIDLIADHIDILNERLNKRGYTMEARMLLHTDQDSDSEDAAVKEMLDVKKMPVISMQSFDARA